MGTSRGYKAPTAGEWPTLKRLAGQFGSGGEGLDLEKDGVDDGPPPGLATVTSAPMRLLSRYVHAHGGAVAMAGGGAGGASGGSGSDGAGGGTRRPGRAVVQAGQRLGHFATRVSQVGLTTALQDIGLGDLVGQPARDVVSALVDRLAGDGSTMDDNLARAALRDLRRDVLGAAKTYKDVERALAEVVEQGHLQWLIVQFYGHYLYDMFCRDFYERFLARFGKDKARRSIDRVKRTIFSALRAKLAGRDPTRVEWRGAEGRYLAESIMTRTLQIFEVGG